MEWWQIALVVIAAILGAAVIAAVAAWILWKRATRQERTVIKRIGALAFGSKLQLALRFLGDRRLPLAVRLILPLLVVYLALPVDFIPDFIPVIGWIDDVFVLVVGLSLVLRLTPLPLLDGHIARLERAELDRDAIEAGPAPGATRSRPPPRLLR